MHNAPVKLKRTIMDNELALIELVKKGDKKAYNALVLKYQDRLVYSVYKFLKDFELSQDIAQEAFIKAFKNIEKFRGDSKFYTWIYRIAINTAKNAISTKARASEAVSYTHLTLPTNVAV